MGSCVAETFKNGVGALNGNDKTKQLDCKNNFGMCLLVLVLMLLINFVLGPWLWNNVLCRLVGGLKKAEWYDTVLLNLLFSLLLA
jgi:hypothetical protein